MTTRAKSLAYLRDGRVRVVAAQSEESGQRPRAVWAIVRGHLDTYKVIGCPADGGGVRAWRCDCGAPEMAEVAEQCAHAAAVALVTGWPSAAAKTAEEVS
jgi:hypothetical protein